MIDQSHYTFLNNNITYRSKFKINNELKLVTIYQISLPSARNVPQEYKKWKYDMVFQLIAIVFVNQKLHREFICIWKNKNLKSCWRTAYCFKTNFSVELTGSNINTNISCKVNCVLAISKI